MQRGMQQIPVLHNRAPHTSQRVRQSLKYLHTLAIEVKYSSVPTISYIRNLLIINKTIVSIYHLSAVRLYRRGEVHNGGKRIAIVATRRQSGLSFIIQPLCRQALRAFSMRLSVSSRPRIAKVASMGGETVPPLTASLIGCASFPKERFFSAAKPLMAS